MKRTVRIFVASSTENLPVVDALCSLLVRARRKTFKVDPISWKKGTFKLSNTYIESLEEELDKTDFSILILTPSDVATIRDESFPIPRDNVLFELGLFMGRHRRERSYMLYERGDDKPKLPTDLLGVRAATYPKSDPSGMEQALAPACREILSRVSEILKRQEFSSFVARVEGEWWELIQTKAGVELSFFKILPDANFKSIYMDGEHFDQQGKMIGTWKSLVAGILEAQRKIFYYWEGQHPPTPEGHALQVKGFGTMEFRRASGPFEKGKGGFMDVDPNAMGTAQWKTVRLERVTNKTHVRTMNNGRLADKETLARQILDEW